MTSGQFVAFIVAAVVAGGMSMGGVTWVYFRDKWRVDPEPAATRPRRPSPFGREV